MALATRKTKRDANEMIAIDTVDLQEMLGCGTHTARMIGEQAGARIQIGRRVLWNVSKIQAYLNTISK